MTPLGLKIRELRKTNNITMKAMAAYLGVSSSYLSQLETGKKGQFSAAMLDQICTMLNLIWDDAEELKKLSQVSKAKVIIDTNHLGIEATRVANLVAIVLKNVDENEAKLMADWLNERCKKI